MLIDQWAQRWGVPPAAVQELRHAFTASCAPASDAEQGGRSESWVSSVIRLESTKKGVRLFRNNVGALPSADGQLVRYGLANESKRMNQALKSSDFIGVKPLLIGPEHMGKTVGQFVAREAKKENWTYSGKGREPAQLNFIQLIAALGGDACFANGEGTL